MKTLDNARIRCMFIQSETKEEFGGVGGGGGKVIGKRAADRSPPQTAIS